MERGFPVYDVGTICGSLCNEKKERLTSSNVPEVNERLGVIN